MIGVGYQIVWSYGKLRVLFLSGDGVLRLPLLIDCKVLMRLVASLRNGRRLFYSKWKTNSWLSWNKCASWNVHPNSSDCRNISLCEYYLDNTITLRFIVAFDATSLTKSFNPIAKYCSQVKAIFRHESWQYSLRLHAFIQTFAYCLLSRNGRMVHFSQRQSHHKHRLFHNQKMQCLI